MSSISCGVAGAKRDGVGVPVAEAAADQLDVRLLGPDATQPWPAAHEVHEHAGTSAPTMYEIPSSIRLKPGELGESHATLPGTAGAVHHVDRRNLADGLDEDAVELG